MWQLFFSRVVWKFVVWWNVVICYLQIDVLCVSVNTSSWLRLLINLFMIKLHQFFVNEMKETRIELKIVVAYCNCEFLPLSLSLFIEESIPLAAERRLSSCTDWNARMLRRILTCIRLTHFAIKLSDDAIANWRRIEAKALRGALFCCLCYASIIMQPFACESFWHHIFFCYYKQTIFRQIFFPLLNKNVKINFYSTNQKN